jgi:hypothetical protein
MIGYNRTKLDTIMSYIYPSFNTFSVNITKAPASMYKVLMEYDESLGIKKEVFFVLYVLVFANKKNTYTLSDKTPDYIFKNGIIPDLNRGLYIQDRIRSRIQKPSEIPSWIMYAFEEIGDGNYINALISMAVYNSVDIEEMFPDTEKMSFLLQKTSLFSKNGFITFEEVKNACENYESEQA